MSIRDRWSSIFGNLCPRHIWALLNRMVIVLMILIFAWMWLISGKYRANYPGGPCGAIVREGDGLRLYTMYDDGIEEAFDSDEYMAMLYQTYGCDDDSLIFPTMTHCWWGVSVHWWDGEESYEVADIERCVQLFYHAQKQRRQITALQAAPLPTLGPPSVIGAGSGAEHYFSFDHSVHRVSNPSGYVLNTAFILGHVYALTLFLLICSPKYWKAGIRDRRLAAGKCPSCQYSIRGLKEPRCPECGTAFSAHHLLDEPAEKSDASGKISGADEASRERSAP